jgi:hypothetical protein
MLPLAASWVSSSDRRRKSRAEEALGRSLPFVAVACVLRAELEGTLASPLAYAFAFSFLYPVLGTGVPLARRAVQAKAADWAAALAYHTLLDPEIEVLSVAYRKPTRAINLVLATRHRVKNPKNTAMEELVRLE